MCLLYSNFDYSHISVFVKMIYWSVNTDLKKKNLPTLKNGFRKHPLVFSCCSEENKWCIYLHIYSVPAKRTTLWAQWPQRTRPSRWNGEQPLFLREHCSNWNHIRKWIPPALAVWGSAQPRTAGDGRKQRGGPGQRSIEAGCGDYKTGFFF